jgi:hypothetical protein
VLIIALDAAMKTVLLLVEWFVAQAVRLHATILVWAVLC